MEDWGVGVFFLFVCFFHVPGQQTRYVLTVHVYRGSENDCDYEKFWRVNSRMNYSVIMFYICAYWCTIEENRRLSLRPPILHYLESSRTTLRCTIVTSGSPDKPLDKFPIITQPLPRSTPPQPYRHNCCSIASKVNWQLPAFLRLSSAHALLDYRKQYDILLMTLSLHDEPLMVSPDGLRSHDVLPFDLY